MSGGRVELGLGAGWFDARAPRLRHPVPAVGERFDRLEEQLAIITGLWSTPVGETVRLRGQALHAGEVPGAAEAGAAAASAGHRRRQRPEAGRRALAARFADEFNIPFPDSVERRRRSSTGCATACEDAGRDPDEPALSAALVLCCGRDDAEVKRRAEAIGHDADELRGDRPGRHRRPKSSTRSAGTPRSARCGSTCRCSTSADLDHLELVASEVAPQVG